MQAPSPAPKVAAASCCQCYARQSAHNAASCYIRIQPADPTSLVPHAVPTPSAAQGALPSFSSDHQSRSPLLPPAGRSLIVERWIHARGDRLHLAVRVQKLGQRATGAGPIRPCGGGRELCVRPVPRTSAHAARRGGRGALRAQGESSWLCAQGAGGCGRTHRSGRGRRHACRRHRLPQPTHLLHPARATGVRFRPARLGTAAVHSRPGLPLIRGE